MQAFTQNQLYRRILGTPLAWLVTKLVKRVSIKQPEILKTAGLTGLNGGQNGGDAGKLGVEVTGISCGLDLRHKGWCHSLVVDIIPVNIAEEWLAHHLLGISWAASESLVRLTSEQLLENGDRVSGHVDRV